MKTEQTKHTAGNWKEGKNHRIETDTAGGGKVVIVDEHAIGNDADRVLICAAPALLQALKGFLYAVEGHERRTGTMQMHPAIDEARQAIRQAEGVQA